MIESIAGIFRIMVLLILGAVLRKSGVLKPRDIDGIKKIILFLALPSLLFLSFSKLSLDLSFIPITASIFTINFVLFWIGVLINKLWWKNNRILPLCLSTMNFALVGLPLYEALFGIDKLYHYTILGVGHEIFAWFVFNFLFRWHLSKGTAGKGFDPGVFKSPVIWGIILGCLLSILKIDLSSSGNIVLLGTYNTVESLSKLCAPLILIFVGYNMSLSGAYIKQGIKMSLLRLVAMLAVGYSLKVLVLDRFIETTIYSNAAFFLLITLPAIFSVPILAADYLEDEELIGINNTIVLHTLFTIIIFVVYTIVFII